MSSSGSMGSVRQQSGWTGSTPGSPPRIEARRYERSLGANRGEDCERKAEQLRNSDRLRAPYTTQSYPVVRVVVPAAAGFESRRSPLFVPENWDLPRRGRSSTGQTRGTSPETASAGNGTDCEHAVEPNLRGDLRDAWVVSRRRSRYATGRNSAGAVPGRVSCSLGTRVGTITSRLYRAREQVAAALEAP